MERLTDRQTGRWQRCGRMIDRWLASFSGLQRLVDDERQVATKRALAMLAVVLQLCRKSLSVAQREVRSGRRLETVEPFARANALDGAGAARRSDPQRWNCRTWRTP